MSTATARPPGVTAMTAGASADINKDGYTDLVLGYPRQMRHGYPVGAGHVEVRYRSEDGLFGASGEEAHPSAQTHPYGGAPVTSALGHLRTGMPEPLSPLAPAAVPGGCADPVGTGAAERTVDPPAPGPPAVDGPGEGRCSRCVVRRSTPDREQRTPGTA
ncbi:FG-GAP repeat protein [Streptomyces sp. H27-C3]|uniref:FG-GAP repeat protein n=1 Tax=Streptomyces sp. H27-C3 TaxID=3046305 RepID=UPI0024BB8E83|nr:FG-GAP repeat protein [Streptomyces sp. H27-C3]MDJ0460330.1 FG-GAP repeat protein [Streptomyces sp. H27-C3]